MQHKPLSPFELLEFHGTSITINTSRKILVLPTGNRAKLPSCNEYTGGRSLPASGTHQFTNDYDQNTGLKNLIYPFIVIYNPEEVYADFYIFLYQPKNLVYINDENYITQLIISRENGPVYHGQIHYPDLARDSNSDSIPDFLTSGVSGSLINLLKSYGLSMDSDLSRNLLINSSFELGATLATRWDAENYATGTPLYSKSTTGVVNGTVSQKIEYTGVVGDNGSKVIVLYQAPVYVSDGDVVDFLIYISGSLTNTNLVYGVESRTSAGGLITRSEATITSLSSTPTQHKRTYTCPTDTVYLVAYIKFTGISQTSQITAYLDDAKIMTNNGYIFWGGLSWLATTGQAMGSALNNWSRKASNLWVDEDQKLHMTIKNDSGAWNCTELRAQNYTYGKFTWKVESPVFSMDKNAVLGVFLYTDDNHEIDIEVSRWGLDQNNLLLFTNQPYDVSGNMNPHLPSITTEGVTTTEAGYNGNNMTLQIDWQPTYIDWKAWDNTGTLIASTHYTYTDRIPSSKLGLMMNLWLRQKQAPSDGQDIEIVISDLDIG